MKDPETYLKHLGITLTCPVQAGVPAVLDAAHRTMVNHEVYFFSSEDARSRFQQDPLRWCGELTDPVSEARFRPTTASEHFYFGGRPYYFTSADTRATFARTPSAFADPKRRMPPPSPAPSGGAGFPAPGAPATQPSPAPGGADAPSLGAAGSKPAPRATGKSSAPTTQPAPPLREARPPRTP